jgi:hypothetical protein
VDLRRPSPLLEAPTAAVKVGRQAATQVVARSRNSRARARVARIARDVPPRADTRRLAGGRIRHEIDATDGGAGSPFLVAESACDHRRRGTYRRACCGEVEPQVRLAGAPSVTREPCSARPGASRDRLPARGRRSWFGSPCSRALPSRLRRILPRTRPGSSPRLAGVAPGRGVAVRVQQESAGRRRLAAPAAPLPGHGAGGRVAAYAAGSPVAAR